MVLTFSWVTHYRYYMRSKTLKSDNFHISSKLNTQIKIWSLFGVYYAMRKVKKMLRKCRCTLIPLNIMQGFRWWCCVLSHNVHIYQGPSSEQTEATGTAQDTSQNVFSSFLQPVTNSIFKLLEPDHRAWTWKWNQVFLDGKLNMKNYKDAAKFSTLTLLVDHWEFLDSKDKQAMSFYLDYVRAPTDN